MSVVIDKWYLPWGSGSVGEVEVENWCNVIGSSNLIANTA